MKFQSETLGEVSIRFQYYVSEQAQKAALNSQKSKNTMLLLLDEILDTVPSILERGTLDEFDLEGLKYILKSATSFKPLTDMTKCIVEFNGLQMIGQSDRNPMDKHFKPVARAVALEKALEGLPREIKLEIHTLWKNRPRLDGKPVNRT